MESWQDEIIKAQISQEIGVEMSMENSDMSVFLKSFKENLIGAVDRDSFDKSWSSDLQSKFPSGGWRTVNGARVFINNGKVIAGLDGFNGEIDKFFDGRGKKESANSGGKKEDKGIKVKRKFDYNGSEIRIVEREEDLGDGGTWKPIRVLTPNGDALPINIEHKETLRSIEDKTRKFLDGAKKRGLDVDKELSRKESKQGEGESSLSDTEKLFFDSAAKKYPKLDKKKTIETRDKIISVDKGATSSINALAEAIIYSSSTIDDYFDEGNHAIKMAIGGKETGHPQAERVLEIGIGGELSKKAKEINDKFLNVRQKTKALSDSSKTLLKIAAERNELSLNDVNEIVNNMKGTELEEVSEAISKFLMKDMPDISTDKQVTLDTFKDIAKKAKDVDDFIKKTMAVKNVPPEVAKEFFDKYGKGKSQKDAALTFMKEHGNKGEANIDLKKQVKQVREGKKKEVDLPF